MFEDMYMDDIEIFYWKISQILWRMLDYRITC